ncbi:hypothetical protein IWQ62_000862 [Dispira parvispora]|uniref:Uncharacterized protein n=1 Tax=Dispira parvispora TaxID=1520584 RepID=A0A9W8AXG6_9FUNG|nr:hypothetical protein IWQ62_000862 [Dispira parvispora]
MTILPKRTPALSIQRALTNVVFPNVRLASVITVRCLSDTSRSSPSTASTRHTPVLLTEVLDILQPRPNQWYLDATFGEGGYTEAILRTCDCRVIAIDQDPYAIEKARQMATQPEYKNRLFPILGPFGDLSQLLQRIKSPTTTDPHLPLPPNSLAGIVYDIGVCSSQIDEPSRGFSYLQDGPLDMRMASKGSQEVSERDIQTRLGRRTLPASVIVNNFTVDQLAYLFRTYGEERYALRIAQQIHTYRQKHVISTTQQLANIIYDAVPHALRQRTSGAGGGKQRRNPAARVFQSLRIYVNDELGELTKSLEYALDLLMPTGRLAVVTFHSLEDKLVKRTFQKRLSAPTDEVTSDSSPRLTYRALTKHVITPSKAETKSNPRARSAKLRAIERIPSPVNDPSDS